MISNYFWASNMTSIPFCSSDFSSIDGSEKSVCEANVGKKMVDKVIDNLTWGR